MLNDAGGCGATADERVEAAPAPFAFVVAFCGDLLAAAVGAFGFIPGRLLTDISRAVISSFIKDNEYIGLYQNYSKVRLI